MKSLPASRLSLTSLTLLYLAVPLLIFFAGWLKPAWALAAGLPIVISLWHLIRMAPVDFNEFGTREISVVAIGSLALTAFVGVGGFAPQHTDWIKHNAVLFDCINLPWPVVLADGTARWPLVYYLAYYLPAAVVGKIAGYAAAQVALWLWTSFGVALSSLWFARLTRLPPAVAFLAFFAFAGLDFAGNILVQVLRISHPEGHLNWYPNQMWAVMWQFPSDFWALEWAPGQALAGWLSAGLFLASPKPLRLACFLFLFACAMLWSPFAAVGLGLFVFFLMRREGWEFSIRSLAPMVWLVLPIGAMTAFYLGKTCPDVTAHFPKVAAVFFLRFHYAPGVVKAFLLLILFIVLNFGVYWWFVRARFSPGTPERNLADACALTFLCLLPVTVGYFSDLSMRASAVPLFCLAVLVVRTVGPGGLAPTMRRWFALVILVGFLTPLVEAGHQAYHIAIRRYDPRVVPHQASAVVNMADGSFPLFGAQYVSSTNAFFFRELAR